MSYVFEFTVLTLAASIQMRYQAIAKVVVQCTKRVTRITKAIVLAPTLQVKIQILYEIRGGHEATFRSSFLMNHAPSFLQGLLGGTQVQILPTLAPQILVKPVRET